MNRTIADLLKPDDLLEPIETGVKTSGTSLTDIRAVIFDIYGTLLVSGSGDVGTAAEAGSPEAFRRAFKKAAGIELSSDAADEVRKAFFSGIEEDHERLKRNGIPYPEVDIIDIWRRVLDKTSSGFLHGNEVIIDASVIAAAYEATVNPSAPMPGAAMLLEKLNSSGFLLGIISNAQFYTPVVFSNSFGVDFSGFGFRDELCLFSYKETRSKPDTFLFEKLKQRLSLHGIKPSQAVFIGNDMLKDIMPASASGYRTALFAGDRRSLRLRAEHDACRNIKPDVILNNLTDLTVFIQDGQHEKTF